MARVGRWGQRLLSTSLCQTPVEQPLVVNIRTQSVMSSDHLLAGRPRRRSPSTIPSITIFTSRWSFILQMCPDSCNFLCFTTSTIVQCLCTLSLTMLLLTLSFQHTLSIFYNISFRMPGVFWSQRLLLSMSRQHRADEKRHTPPADQSWLWWSTRYSSRTSLAFPIYGLRGCTPPVLATFQSRITNVENLHHHVDRTI